MQTENFQLEQIIIDLFFFSHVLTMALILSKRQPSLPDSCHQEAARHRSAGKNVDFNAQA